MSYPLDLDEMSTKKLQEELERRIYCKEHGECPYCLKQIGSEPSCKMRDMHSGKDSA